MENGYLESNGDVKLFLHIQTNTKKTEFAGFYNGLLKIRLAAPPIEGKANQLLITWLAKKLLVPQKRLTLIAGKASRKKTILVKEITASEIEKLLIN